MANSASAPHRPEPPAVFARALLEGQKAAIRAVEAAMPAIEAAAGAMAGAISAGGRIVYAGAGSSGLIGLQDGAELSGTFGLAPDRVVFLLAGGLADIAHIDAAAEDDSEAAAREMDGVACRSGDVLVAASASGSTRYTLTCAEVARRAGARVIGLANRADAPLLRAADFPVFLDSGPEALHGSTRLGAGTAQKAALGLISTLAHAQLGHVWRGHMVAMRAENEKLRARARHIVSTLAGCAQDEAERSLALAGDDVKRAILIASGARAETAATLLDEAGGHVGAALARIRDSQVA